MFAAENYFIFLALLISSELVPISDAFIKRNYNLEVEAFEVVRHPSFLLKTHFLRLGKYNSTAYVVNSNFTVTEDLPPDMMVHVTAFQLMSSNKYSMIPVGLKPFNLCDWVEKDKQFYPAFLAKSNFPKKCPVRKGNLWLKNFTLDVDYLPPELPGERWRVDVVAKNKKRTATIYRAYIFVNRSI